MRSHGRSTDVRSACVPIEFLDSDAWPLRLWVPETVSCLVRRHFGTRGLAPGIEWLWSRATGVCPGGPGSGVGWHPVPRTIFPAGATAKGPRTASVKAATYPLTCCDAFSAPSATTDFPAPQVEKERNSRPASAAFSLVNPHDRIFGPHARPTFRRGRRLGHSDHLVQQTGGFCRLDGG